MMTTKLPYRCALKPGIRTQYKVQRPKFQPRVPRITCNESFLKVFNRALQKEWEITQLTGASRQLYRFRQYLKRKVRRLERRKKYRKMTRQEHIMVAEINKAFANYRPTDAGSKVLQEYVEGALAPGTPEQVTGIEGSQET